MANSKEHKSNEKISFIQNIYYVLPLNYTDNLYIMCAEFGLRTPNFTDHDVLYVKKKGANIRLV